VPKWNDQVLFAVLELPRLLARLEHLLEVVGRATILDRLILFVD
jgi:hypothetical protein